MSNVYSPKNTHGKITMREAISQALMEEMDRDPLFYYG